VRRVAIFVVLAMITFATALSCTVMNGLHVPLPDAAVAEVEAGPDAAPDTSDPCVHARPPLPNQTDFGGAEGEILVAVRSFGFAAEAGAPTTIGFDVDNSCTCGSGKETCVSGEKHCDDVNGRDNTLASLLGQLKRAQGYDFEADINKRLDAGSEGILIRVQRYNGRADDSDVTVSIYGSAGTGVSDGDGGILRVAPQWTKDDPWVLDEGDLLGDFDSHFSRNIASSAYVADSTLVATITPHIRLLAGAYTTLKGTVFTGKIVQTPDGPTIVGGTFGARWPTTEILTSLSLVADPNTGILFCETPGFDSLAKSFICPAADVAIDPSLDNTGSPCNAISVGIDYTAAPAGFGTHTLVSPDVAGCQDAGPIVCDTP
jgi:hypothetical protein